MKTLCIDTSTLATMALVENGVTLGKVEDPNARRQAEGLGILLGDCLEDANLSRSAPAAHIDRVVVGVGPGPYTALRAGIAFAATLARSLSVPVYGVPSVEGMGWEALEHIGVGETGCFLVLSDARRKEVYAALYARGEDGGLRQIRGAWVEGPEQALRSATCSCQEEGDGGELNVFFFGSIPPHVQDALEHTDATVLSLDPAKLERAVDTKVVGSANDFGLEPLYLRRPDIHGQPA